jgi:hypothetical protein
MGCFGLVPDAETDEEDRGMGGVCINGQCGKPATRTVSGVRVCDSCTVESYPAERDGRTIVIVRR